MHHWVPLAGRRPALLFAALALASLALFLPAARPANALTCPPGCGPGTGPIYYTDATRRTELCRITCYDDTCQGQTSRWFRIIHNCCCA